MVMALSACWISGRRAVIVPRFCLVCDGWKNIIPVAVGQQQNGVWGSQRGDLLGRGWRLQYCGWMILKYVASLLETGYHGQRHVNLVLDDEDWPVGDM